MALLLKKDFKCPAGFQESGVYPDQGFLEDLNESQELVLIKAPADFDIGKLNGQVINLSGKQELESNNEKKTVVDVSGFSKHLDNICFLKKVEDSDKCIPVGVRFKKQIDIYESYSFPTASLPASQLKHVPRPANLTGNLTPYGSDDPVVFYKCKKRPKKNRIVSPDKNLAGKDIPFAFSQYDTENILERKVWRELNVDANGLSDGHSSSPAGKKIKKKKKKGKEEIKLVRVKDSTFVSHSDNQLDQMSTRARPSFENGKTKVKKEKVNRKIKHELFSRVESESESDLDKTAVCNQDSVLSSKKSKVGLSKPKLNDSSPDKVMSVKASKKIKTEPRSEESDEF